YVVTCDDSDSSTFDGWVGVDQTVTTMTFTLTVNDVDSGQVFAGNFKAQCRASGAAPNATWGTAQNVSITMTTAGNNYTATTAAVTPNGGPCLAGRSLFLRVAGSWWRN